MGDAHSPMDKGLNLHIFRYMGPDLFQFFQGKLPGGHHTGCSQIMPEPVGSVIGTVGLGADMNLDLGAYFPGDSKYTGIGYDQGIRLKLF